jgi:hypothetical protein
MKSLLALAIAAGALWAANTGSASAQGDPYRWCAEFSAGEGGSAANCYFITRAQCEATVSGIGGFCRVNQLYTGPQRGYDDTPEPPPRRTKRTPR